MQDPSHMTTKIQKEDGGHFENHLYFLQFFLQFFFTIITVILAILLCHVTQC